MPRPTKAILAICALAAPTSAAESAFKPAESAPERSMRFWKRPRASVAAAEPAGGAPAGWLPSLRGVTDAQPLLPEPVAPEEVAAEGEPAGEPAVAPAANEEPAAAPKANEEPAAAAENAADADDGPCCAGEIEENTCCSHGNCVSGWTSAAITCLVTSAFETAGFPMLCPRELLRVFSVSTYGYGYDGYGHDITLCRGTGCDIDMVAISRDCVPACACLSVVAQTTCVGCTQCCASGCVGHCGMEIYKRWQKTLGGWMGVSAVSRANAGVCGGFRVRSPCSEGYRKGIFDC